MHFQIQAEIVINVKFGNHVTVHRPSVRTTGHQCSISYFLATVSDKNRWDTLTKRCFFPSRAPLVRLKVVYRSSVTKSCTPTWRGQGDPKVSQPF